MAIAIMNSQHLVMNRGKIHGPTPPGDPLATDGCSGRGSIDLQ